MCWREMESRSGNKNTVNIQKQLIPIVDIFFDGLWGKTQISHCYRTLICTCVSLRNCGKCNFTNRGTCAHQQSINWSTNRQSEGWHLQLSSSQVFVLLRWCLWGLHHCGVESEHNVQVLTGGKKKVPTRDIKMNSHSLSDSWQASHVGKSIFKSPCLLWCWQRGSESIRRIHLYFRAFWSGPYPKSRGRDWTKKMRWSWLGLLYNDGDHTTMKMAAMLQQSIWWSQWLRWWKVLVVLMIGLCDGRKPKKCLFLSVCVQSDRSL